MNIIDVKGIVPGSGKTTLLIKAFISAKLKNKYILTPTNKARQECQRKLIEFGHKELFGKVITLRKFKRNFVAVTEKYRRFDIEANEYVEEVGKTQFFTCPSKDQKGKVYNLFIDESGMISHKEIEDLIEHFTIGNLILCGDSLQFEPIPNIVSFEKKGERIEWKDKGEKYHGQIDHQILLNRNYRSKDEKLSKAVENIKKGNLMEALDSLCSERWDEERKPDDWNIVYTNKRCDAINKLYGNPQRFIVTAGDNVYNFAKSEIIEFPKDEERMKDLERMLTYENMKDEKKPTYDEWKERHLKPAYALTSHKLQGSTIEEGNVIIVLSDLLDLDLEEYMTNKEKFKVFQTFLYVAVSRAVSSKQIKILWSSFTNKKGKEVNFDLMDIMIGSSREDKYTEEWLRIGSQLQAADENAEEMIDKSIWEKPDWVGPSGDALEPFLQLLDYECEEAEKKAKEFISEAHSVKHKQHKQKYTDEFLSSVSKEELYKLTQNAKVRKRWNELQNL